MTPNLLILGASSLIPFVVAIVWFHKGLFGGDNWTEIAGLTKEQAANDVKPLKLLLSIVLNFFVAFAMYNLVVHASGVFGLMGADTEAMMSGTSGAFLAEHGKNFLTFSHGAFHGITSAIMIAVPMYGYVAIFERKSTKYFLVNVGYWLVSMVLMGGVIAQWGWTAL